MFAIQEMIHRFEEGKASNLLKIILVYLLLFTVGVLYNLRAYRNFSSEEAMDGAQIARNIAQGKGFSTSYVRPVSIDLVVKKKGSANLKENHPDLANAPVYPMLLAVLLKAMPFNEQIQNTAEVPFRRFRAEIAITVLNQVLFLLVIIWTFSLAKNLFDPTVAWISAALVAGTELLWRFTNSGLSTILIILLLLSLLSVLVKIERLILAEIPTAKLKVAGWTVLAGLNLGLLALCRYSLGWLIIPILVYALLSYRQYRWGASAALAVSFCLLVFPWLIRNYTWSGNFFGTAGYALLQGTTDYPGNLLERGLKLGSGKVPSLTEGVTIYIHKFVLGFRESLQSEVPRFSGNWIVALFLASLFVPFSNQVLVRLRRILISSMLTLLIVQVLGKTHLSSDSPVINSENLLVLFSPLVFIFGAAVFTILLDQIELPFPPLRYAVYLSLLLTCSLPLLFQLLPPSSSPLAYPPYYPPVIQKVSKWMAPRELMMSDVPWAVAWYAQKKCVLLTQNPGEQFLRMNDEVQTIDAIYLTQVSINSNVLDVFKRQSWAYFTLTLLTKGEVPPGFPLKKMWSEMFPEQLVLTDWDRWKESKISTKIN